jgi:hypothetical protein
MQYLAGILGNGKYICTADTQTDCVMYIGSSTCIFYDRDTGECKCRDTQHRDT